MSEIKENDKEILEFKAGDIVMEQGQLARGLYILMYGKLDVYFNDVKVAEITDKGAFVGEIASILGGRRIAQVTASVPTKMMYIKDITGYFESNPSSALMVAKTLASRIMEMNEKLVKFEKVAESWIKAGEDAVEKNDVSIIKASLADMKEFFVRQITSG